MYLSQNWQWQQSLIKNAARTGSTVQSFLSHSCILFPLLLCCLCPEDEPSSKSAKTTSESYFYLCTSLHAISVRFAQNRISWPCVLSNVSSSVPVSNTIVLSIICKSQFHTERYLRLPCSQAAAHTACGKNRSTNNQVNFWITTRKGCRLV